jgi:serine/threonine-protein kinase
MADEILAHYRLHERIGAGGMGEVYRATDSRLNRDVAVKVLPELFANDKERMARFQREAQVLASLSHPSIASIFGFEESGGRRALIMELVDGEDLSQRLARGPLPSSDALRIALALTEGLETAHERGIIHRDLKPANIKLMPDGRVKILDFGLAKALEGSPALSASDPSQSPTISLAATQAGFILGTAAYMSPEQASGRPADKRSDVWSFGVVLFEMLSGTRLFEGETVSHTLADVLRADIDWARLPGTTPPAIIRLLHRCLERDVRHRLRDIGEARIVVEEQLAAMASGLSSLPSPAPAPRPARSGKPLIPWAIAASAVLVAAAAVTRTWWAPVPMASMPRINADVKLTDDKFWTQLGPAVALSPDGSRIAYVTGTEQSRALYVRSLDQLESMKLAEGDTAETSPYHPFFSPDGQWIGFVTSSELRKVPVSGGTPITLCPVSRSRGATWTSDGMIVFAASPDSGLSEVPAVGGEPKPITTLDTGRKETTHRWPQVLPGGKAVLFTAHTQSIGNFDQAAIEVVVLATGERKVIHRGGSFGRYVPSGHIVYLNKGTIFALPFDVDRLEATGSPAPVVQNVTASDAEGAAQLTFSDTGLMAYVRGTTAIPRYPIAWVDRNGRSSKLLDEEGAYATPRLSPDGKRLALTMLRDANWDIWVYDLERQVMTRLTFDKGADTEQIWSPDGRDLIFTSTRSGPDSLFRKPSDGSGQEVQVAKLDTPMWASTWRPDGSEVGFMTTEPGFDIGVIAPGSKDKPQMVAKSQFSETDPMFSYDGRWIAYSSNESGQIEIYVQSYPAGGGRWQVSDGGGAFPRWSANGKELFYRSRDGIMAVPIDTSGGTLKTGSPRALFTGAFRGGLSGISIAGQTFADYDVTRDGQRFVMFPTGSTTETARAGLVTVVSSWFDDLSATFARSKGR